MIAKTILLYTATALATQTNRICKDVFKGQLLRHPDCNTFYQCFSGIAVEGKCPYGLHLNVEKQLCQEPELAGCRIETATEADEEDSSKLYATWYEEEAANVCSRNGTELLPHWHCNQYYKCLHGNPLALHCRAHELYDTVKGRCDSEMTVQCNERLVENY